ncbi:MAG: DUF1800 domain-containing protein [Microcoleaceae cyanobacterium]
MQKLINQTVKNLWKLTVITLIICGLIFPTYPSYANTPVNNDRAKIIHVLNRLAFGPQPGDIEQIESQGINSYIQSQLNPQMISDPPALRAQLQQLPVLSLDPVQVFQQYWPVKPKVPKKPTPQDNQVALRKRQQVLNQARKARLIRAVSSKKQLQEVMVDFWFNHFNVDASKAQTKVWIASYDEKAIRPHIFGKFRDLLGATAKHPAMLFYLDNWLNTAPGSKGVKGNFKGLNENYARELMELHTLGVDGGYTQQDIISLAKILTGWGIERRQGNTGFIFDSDRHDFSDKIFLGKTIKGSGLLEGEQALDLLAKHPATARHISYKLAQYFVADQPPASLVKTLSDKFLATDGNIKEVLTTLFNSTEFWQPQYYGAKFKTPYRFVLSTVRATGTDQPNTNRILNMIRQLGMPLYTCLTPDGYKNTQDAWLNPDAMMRRVSIVNPIARGELNIDKAKQKPVNPQVLTKTLGNNFSTKTSQVIETSPPNLRSALILGSPEMMRN